LEIRDTHRAIAREDRSGVLHPDNLTRYAATVHEAGPGIGEVVDHFWTVSWDLPDGERIDQRILTDPAVTLTIESGRVPAGLVVTGVHRRAWASEIAGRGAGFAIRLRPAGLAVVSDLDPYDIADRTVAVTPHLDARLHGLLCAVADVAETPSRIARTREIIGAMSAERPLSDRQRLANETVDAIQRGDPLPPGRSERTVQRALRETIGVGPAWVRRWVRLQEAARQFAVEGEAGAARIAARLGFTDQAHLINEFRAATGLTPGAYIASLRRPLPSPPMAPPSSGPGGRPSAHQP
jgi:hypothetical protein